MARQESRLSIGVGRAWHFYSDLKHLERKKC